MRALVGRIRSLWCQACQAFRKQYVREGEEGRCAQCQGILSDAQQDLARVRGVVADDIPGGLVMEHVEPGRKVYTRTELHQVLARHGYRVSDYGWTGEAETVYTKHQPWADLRTTAQREEEMAAFLGMAVEEYRKHFGGVDRKAKVMP